ncbi:hypothetical protein GCM10010329_04970 [Streptomyces spiroverticillatus]|uniref:Uncharacterized protein n=1 Tax=Streptomyces finlayi TaxID=67296 RepID=A0A918WSQ8_9ACTN|nr:hypothetical protein [Streptomyces finlayi]GGZ87923.1 hypothetical protein GCM10010329_04970 [Streptomyces spiroverticillatus]GHC79047.1 hypothetical protein GCM10010334_04950 [Streptomyces finlayi]
MGGELPDELRELGRSIRVPEGIGESMAERVLAQLLADGVPTPLPPVSRWVRLRGWARRRWRALAAGVSGLLVVLALTPPVRAAVADWFGFGGVGVRYEPGRATPSPDPVPGCPGAVPLAEAERRAGFSVRLPQSLGRPGGASVSADGRVLSVCWADGGGRGGGPVRLDVFRAGLDPLFFKTVSGEPEWTEVGTNTALWFPEPHRLTLRLQDAAGQPYAPVVRTAAPTLVWQGRDRALTWRLEGVTPMARAVEVAESAGN